MIVVLAVLVLVGFFSMMSAMFDMRTIEYILDENNKPVLMILFWRLRGSLIPA